MVDCDTVLLCFLALQHGQGKYEYCHSAHVRSVQLESCNCWVDSVILLLGLPSHADCWRDMGRHCWWKVCFRICSYLVVYCHCSDSCRSEAWGTFLASYPCFHGNWRGCCDACYE